MPDYIKRYQHRYNLILERLIVAQQCQELYSKQFPHERVNIIDVKKQFESEESSIDRKIELSPNERDYSK